MPDPAFNDTGLAAPPPRRESGIKWARWAVGVLGGLALLAGLAFGAGLFIYKRSVVVGTQELARLAGSDGRINILLIGDDERKNDLGRADTLMLASFEPVGGRAAVLSIPRDTRVRIAGRRGYHKINEAVALGGPDLVARTVADFLDLHIDYYVKVNFNAFERVIDALGGVEIDVEKPMRYVDHWQNLNIDLKPGHQVLNGNQALQYVRYRADQLGDVALVVPGQDIYDGRVQRQLKFVRAAAKKVLTPGVLLRLPYLVPQVRGLVETNIPTQTMVDLAVALRKVDPQGVATGLVPGDGETIGGVSYWVANPAKMTAEVSRLFQSAGSGVGREAAAAARPVPADVTSAPSTPGHTLPTVEVLNGSGITGLAAQAAERLRETGYPVVFVGNADHFRYRTTRVIARRAERNAALAVSRLLDARVGGTARREADAGEPTADLVIVLGSDYRVD